MISNVETKVMSAYANAIHKMLVGTDRLEPGLAFSAGHRRTMQDTVTIAEVVQTTRHDMLRLGFEWSEDEFQMTELALFIWQDRGTLTVPSCHLYLPAGSDRAWLVTSETSPRMFGLEAKGVVRFDTVPEDLEAGKGRAVSRLQSLLPCRTLS
ncbi:hypothetical protein [Erythrobacter sp. A6_0]|uniref:hypothetical protein n=1 Tax=Erythrobacter sp. A6_0 TaxID=2821089 RepID=UPI001AD9FC0C|nr:hypothetical protein [Erythrobacter sp. A6_0]MBO9510881.1 hypothetical protein [Erythrobacter sp. A6_0]